MAAVPLLRDTNMAAVTSCETFNGVLCNDSSGQSGKEQLKSFRVLRWSRIPGWML